MKVASLRIDDEVNCAFVGIDKTHLKYISDKFSIPAPNFFFHPKYKLGIWDGRIKFFTLKGATFTFLLDEILPVIIGLGYKVRIFDKRKGEKFYPEPIDDQYFHKFNDQETGEPIVLRNYQVEVVNTLLAEGNGIAIAPTGSGKTIVCAALCSCYETKGMRTITIVPDKNLIVQTRDVYRYLNLDVGEYSGERKDLAHMHIVSTWQSIQNYPILVRDFQVVIVDECHTLRGAILREILVKYGKKIVHRFGVTATLPKPETDRMMIKAALGNVLYDLTASTLIQRGVLSNIKITVLQNKIDLRRQYEEYLSDPERERKTYKQFKDEFLPDFQSEKAFLNRHQGRLRFIAEYVTARGAEKKGNILCLVNSISLGRDLSELIEGSIFLCGKDKMADRKAIYDLFAENDNITVVATVHIAGVGIDIRRIFYMMYIDIGKSAIRVIQAVGRGLRKAVDKDMVSVVDFCSDLKYSRRHVRERLNLYRDAQYPYRKIILEEEIAGSI